MHLEISANFFEADFQMVHFSPMVFAKHPHNAKTSIRRKKYNSIAMKYPAIYVNHGGGPLPLMGRQPSLAKHMEHARRTFLPKEPPKSIVVLSAHWESDPVKITASAKPKMLYDYYGFPQEAYEYKYDAPGNPQLAKKIQTNLLKEGIKAELDYERGYDHGVFVPLMLMYPEADIPVVAVSLHKSLDVGTNLKIGSALSNLEDTLVVGSGFTFHNFEKFHAKDPTSRRLAKDFNEWLKETMLGDDRVKGMVEWEKAPGARHCHPREEHLLPLFMTSMVNEKAELIYEEDNGTFPISSYMFS